MNDVLVPDAKLMRAFSSFVSSSFLALLVDDQPSYKHRVNALNFLWNAQLPLHPCPYHDDVLVFQIRLPQCPKLDNN